MSRNQTTQPGERLLRVLTFAGLVWLSFPALLSLGATDSPIRVVHVAGTLHGFLVLRDERGQLLADGELVQFVTGPDRLKSELTFHFKDGSLLQEITIFSQRRYFHLLNDHLVQRGPTFKTQIDQYIDAVTGFVTVRYSDEHEQEKVVKQRMNLPVNLANGLVSTLLENIPPKQIAMTLALVVATPKPRLVKLELQTEGQDTFAVGGTTCKANRYLGRIDIGGVAGAVAGIVGKQPVDSHFWIVPGAAPLFLKSVGPQFDDGPLWEIDLVFPVESKVSPHSAENN
jgi:hypothetical protein